MMEKVSTSTLERLVKRVHIMFGREGTSYCNDPKGCWVFDSQIDPFTQSEQSFAAAELLFLREQAEKMAQALEVLDHIGVRGHTTKYREEYPKEDNG
jgi:hypothetical protein